MSLLMKALKRAEESRSPEPRASVSGARPVLEELTLEAFGPDQARPPRAMSGGGWSSEHAASLAAAQTAGTNAGRPLLPWIAATAALLLMAWGIYVYLQVREPAPLTVTLTAPVPRAPTFPVRDAAEAPAPSTPSEPTRIFAEPVNPAPLAGSVPERPDSPVPAAAPSKPSIDNARRAENSVAIIRNATPVAPSPLLLNAYHSFQEGHFADAEKQYQALLQSEPRNQDVLLGLAAIAQQRGNAAQAGDYYLRVADLDPKNAVAQAGLASLVGASDPAAAQARLQRLLARQSGDSGNPEQTATLHFALGNLYAGQSHWPDAEQAYFQAQRLAPDNPDYAFNLAVSLDHLFQTKPALMYYQRAQQLLRQRGNANLDPSALAARIAQLSAPHADAPVALPAADNH
jgi:tetratricopeptide (TPR) repeat protein